MFQLDAVDRKILEALRLNARVANTQLAADVGLSPSACLRRVQILEQQGVIRGYTTLVGTGLDEQGVAVIVQITLERQTENYLNRFESAIRKHREVRECFLMTGGADYLLRVEAANAGDFERIHKDVLSKLPGVSRIHSSFAIRNVLAESRR